jgi:hypothetical protein
MQVDSKAPGDVMLHFNGEAATTGPEILIGDAASPF